MAQVHLPSRNEDPWVSLSNSIVNIAHGNNIGNLNLVRKVPVADDTTFSDSQKEIKAVKQNISQYHTRAMRQVMYDVFGHSTPSRAHDKTGEEEERTSARSHRQNSSHVLKTFPLCFSRNSRVRHVLYVYSAVR